MSSFCQVVASEMVGLFIAGSKNNNKILSEASGNHEKERLLSVASLKLEGMA